MDINQNNTFNGSTTQSQFSAGGPIKKNNRLKIIIIVSSSILFLGLALFFGWFIFLKDNVSLKEYSNDSLVLKAPDSGYEVKGDFASDRSVVWSKNIESQSKLGYVQVSSVDWPSSVKHDEILSYIDKDLSTSPDNLARSDNLKVDDISGYSYSKFIVDGIDSMKITFSVNKDGNKVYESYRHYRVKGNTIYALLIKIGVENKGLLDKYSQIVDSFKLK